MRDWDLFEGVNACFDRDGELILFLSRPKDLISFYYDPFALPTSSKSLCVLDP